MHEIITAGQTRVTEVEVKPGYYPVVPTPSKYSSPRRHVIHVQHERTKLIKVEIFQDHSVHGWGWYVKGYRLPEIQQKMDEKRAQLATKRAIEHVAETAARLKDSSERDKPEIQPLPTAALARRSKRWRLPFLAGVAVGVAGHVIMHLIF